MHGSILPKMILPLLFIGCWATAITYVNQKVWPCECYLHPCSSTTCWAQGTNRDNYSGRQLDSPHGDWFRRRYGSELPKLDSI